MKLITRTEDEEVYKYYKFVSKSRSIKSGKAAEAMNAVFRKMVIDRADDLYGQCLRAPVGQ